MQSTLFYVHVSNPCATFYIKSVLKGYVHFYFPYQQLREIVLVRKQRIMQILIEILISNEGDSVVRGETKAPHAV